MSSYLAAESEVCLQFICQYRPSIEESCLTKRVLSYRGSSKMEDACDMYVRAANMYKMAKNWCGKSNYYWSNKKSVWPSSSLYLQLPLNLPPDMKHFSAAGNAFSQAARLHLQMQSKHDAATNFIDAGNAFKKADPQGND